VAALVFSDYRLIYNFIDDCSEDIDKYSCGRIEKLDDTKPTQQGKTIECLSRKFVKLDAKCRRQILRVSELQSEDFHLDRTLYFACREDRERFCETVPSGQGKVYKCLMKNKFNQLMSKECMEQLTKRQRIISEDVAADRSLITACKKDILQYECRDKLRDKALNDNMKLANVILCLEGASREGNKLDPECKAEILEHRKAIMADYQINPNLVDACADEINNYCGGGTERGGKTLHCLMRKARISMTKKNSGLAFGTKCISEVNFFFTFWFSNFR
jgi:Golgi apparatus protein 1